MSSYMQWLSDNAAPSWDAWDQVHYRCVAEVVLPVKQFRTEPQNHGSSQDDLTALLLQALPDGDTKETRSSTPVQVAISGAAWAKREQQRRKAHREGLPKDVYNRKYQAKKEAKRNEVQHWLLNNDGVGSRHI